MRFKFVLLAAAYLCVDGLATNANTLLTFRVDMASQIASNTFIPGVNTVWVNGSFNGWSAPAITMTRVGTSSIYSNSVNDTTDANDSKVEYKFITDVSTYENTLDGHNRASRLPATSGASLELPTPYFNDAGPIQTNSVTFRVDMSQQVKSGAFNPNAHTVYVRGSFNGFGLSSALTHDPSILRTNLGNVTTNVYAGTFQVIGSPNAAEDYKFYYFNGADVWESAGAVNSTSDTPGNRYFVNATQTLPIFYFSDDAGTAVVGTNSPTSLGEAGRILPPVLVTFTNSATIPPNQAGYVVGSLPQLGAWDTTRAVRMVGGTITIGLTEGVSYEYKFLTRDECPATPTCYGDSNNGTLEAGANRTGATPPGPPAPYTGKTIFYYSSWTNVSVSYSNNLIGWTSKPMTSVGPGLWRVDGLNNAGDRILYFGFENGSGGLDNVPSVSRAPSHYETPLDAFVVRDGQIYNYWPLATNSGSRIETYNLVSTNLANRTFRVYVPRGYDQNTYKRYPVLYMHDGQNLFLGAGPFGASWNSDLNANNLIGLGKMREMIIVGVDNSADRTTDYLPDYCGGNANKYYTLLHDEVMPFINSHYRTLTDRENTYTMGSSLGGLVSFYLGWEHPDVFSKIAPMSTFFPACLQTKVRLGPPFAPKSLRIYMDSGTTDPGVPNDDVGDNIEARDNLVKNGFVPNVNLLHVIGYAETHNEAWWDYRTPFAWTFLFPATEEPDTVLDTAAPPRITNFQDAGTSNIVTWTSYMARTYTVQAVTNNAYSNSMHWFNIFTTTPETRPWNYPSFGVSNSFHFIRIRQNYVPDWPN